MGGRGSNEECVGGSGMMGNEAMFIEEAKKWVKVLEQRRLNQDNLESLSLNDIQIIQAQKGSILFNQILPKELADRRGNCHVGAIASIIDAVGATAIAAYTGDLKVSVDFNISYFSTVKIEEEVEIEAKVVAHRGKLSLTTVEFRRKKDRVVVALGKLWQSQVNAISGFRTRL
ncbi:putative esterase C31F10.02 [Telopea speciosissima]|uniref:putative esterase C31F10.02 n=1 Tax=Telopea speciosissima TaxID=54955 RepID=UPI001CC7936C|nr:putative esterase C31F10.02 [Telopea speciosissima]